MRQLARKTKFSRNSRWLSACVIVTVAIGAHAENPSAQLLERVSGNVVEQEHNIPDFVATEDVTKQELVNDKLVHEKHVVSQFQVVYDRMKERNEEHRRVLSATEDGKAVDRTISTLPLGVRGGFADDAPSYFGKANLICFDFDVARQEQWHGRDATVLAIRRKKIANPTCPGAHARGATAWIDAETGRILQLELEPGKEREFCGPFNRVNGVYTFVPIIEYGEVQIADRKYWVPFEKRVDFVKEDGKVKTKYVVRYSQFHKFASTSRIVESGN